jgi:hypothetical protein
MAEIGLDATGDAIRVVLPQGDEGLGHIRCVRRAGAVLGIGHGQAPEITESAGFVHGHAVAIGVHAAKLPDRAGHALLSRVFEFDHGLIRSALP